MMNSNKRTYLKTLFVAGLLTTLAMPSFAQEAPTMPEVPVVVQAWVDAWNAADSEAMAQLFAADGVYEDYAFQAIWTGPEQIAQWVEITSANIPDAHIEILEAYQAGNRATVRWVFHGTPERLGEIEGTGKSFSVSAVSVLELEGEQISRISDFYNLANLLRQLGLEAGPWVPPFGVEVLK
jgi:steroid delta-isomerase-like uncharacterized protein